MLPHVQKLSALSAGCCITARCVIPQMSSDSEQTIVSESYENSTDQDDFAMKMELAGFGKLDEDEPLGSRQLCLCS